MVLKNQPTNPNQQNVRQGRKGLDTNGVLDIF